MDRIDSRPNSVLSRNCIDIEIDPEIKLDE